MSSLRDRLLNRARPSDTCPVRIDDDTEARREVEQARLRLSLLEMQSEAPGPDAIAKARTLLKRAESKLKRCYEFVTLRALAADDWEALIDAHKPRPDTDDRVWNAETFPRAAFMACVESDLTVEDWDHVWATVLSNAEQIELSNAAIRVNVRVPDSSLPKGWARIETSG